MQKKDKSPIGDYRPDARQIENARTYWRNAGRKFDDGEVDHFIAYHEARGNKFVSWDAAWKTWYVSALKYAGGRVIPKVKPPRKPVFCHPMQEPYTQDEVNRAKAICKELRQNSRSDLMNALEGIRKGYWWAVNVEERIKRNEEAAKESKQAKR